VFIGRLVKDSVQDDGSQTRLETFDIFFQPTVSDRLVQELAGLAFVQLHT